jgi:hypothetical protein
MHGPILTFLTTLFFLRVLGQALVAFFSVSWLPAMQQWFSGLIPYPVLLTIQIVMMVCMVKISMDIWLGTGRFATTAVLRAMPHRLQRYLRRSNDAALCFNHDLPSGDALAWRHDTDLLSFRFGSLLIHMGTIHRSLRFICKV